MKKIGIGYESYKQFVEQDLYYVDKTLLIRDILEKGGAVTLLTRPRRFGKTLGLSMLRTFFELEYDRKGQVIDKRPYFEGKQIMTCGREVLDRMGRYPVVNLSLKGAKQPDFISAFTALHAEIIWEFGRHDYLQDSEALSEGERKNFKAFLNDETAWRDRMDSCGSKQERKAIFASEVTRYAAALKTLSALLKKHHGKNVIILLDEYDVPLENAWFSGFYDEMTGFIRSFLESALKTNDALEFAVVTGCLRISKESIFTGLNNLNIISIRSGSFSEAFGFTEEETMRLLSDYGLRHKFEEVKEWYDGHLFGENEIYNPWSLTKYVYEQRSRRDALPEPYWSNTSSNSIVKDLVYQADEAARQELDLLIAGGTIEKQIHEDITYADIQDIRKADDNLWNFLLPVKYGNSITARGIITRPCRSRIAEYKKQPFHMEKIHCEAAFLCLEKSNSKNALHFSR